MPNTYITSTYESSYFSNFFNYFDFYKLYKNPNYFILHDLYNQSVENGKNIAFKTICPVTIANCLRGRVQSRIYVISGDRNNILQVTDYGEKNKDELARKPFEFTSVLVGRSTLMNTLGAPAGHQKNQLRKQLMNKPAEGYHNPLQIAYDVARRRFNNALNQWSETESFNLQINYVGANIVGECVLGVPELPKKFIPGLRDVGNELLADDHKLEDLKKHASFLKKMTQELYEMHQDEILASGKFIVDDADLDGSETAEEIKQKLINLNSAALFIVEGNLSTTLMMGLMILNDPEYLSIKRKLAMEIQDYKLEHGLDELSLEDLRKLPYLDQVFYELLRVSATASVITRFTSTPSELIVVKRNGQKETHQIPAHSILFTPLRSMLHDARLWSEPRYFCPERFMDSEMGKYRRKQMVAFSLGKRECPAQHGFVETVVKAVLVESLKVRMVLDKPMEFIPTEILNTSFKQEYRASVFNETTAVKHLGNG